jgi:hypothetical protein
MHEALCAGRLCCMRHAPRRGVAGTCEKILHEAGGKLAVENYEGA